MPLETVAESLRAMAKQGGLARGEAARDPGDLGQLTMDVASGQARFWHVHRHGVSVAWGLDKVEQREIGRVLDVLMLVGDGMGDWLNTVLEWLDDCARAEGAEYITVCGRPGWRPVLAGKGYRSESVQMTKKI